MPADTQKMIAGLLLHASPLHIMAVGDEIIQSGAGEIVHGFRVDFINDLNLKAATRISIVFAYMLLLTLSAAYFFPVFLVPSIFSAVVLFILNWDLYRFFNEKRGFIFALKTVPWHWLYFLYSGLAFAVGFAEYQIKKAMS